MHLNLPELIHFDCTGVSNNTDELDKLTPAQQKREIEETIRVIANHRWGLKESIRMNYEAAQKALEARQKAQRDAIAARADYLNAQDLDTLEGQLRFFRHIGAMVSLFNPQTQSFSINHSEIDTILHQAAMLRVDRFTVSFPKPGPVVMVGPKAKLDEVCAKFKFPQTLEAVCPNGKIARFYSATNSPRCEAFIGPEFAFMYRLDIAQGWSFAKPDIDAETGMFPELPHRVDTWLEQMSQTPKNLFELLGA
jgi:hypothetical protein